MDKRQDETKICIGIFEKSTYLEGEKRDLIDMYIEQLQSVNKEGSSFWGKEGLLNSVSSVVELFIAGGETTSVTINWALIFLGVNQESQKRLQDEIDKVIGRDREPSLQDKLSMPYAEAVILETLRLSSIAPLGVIHMLLEDVPFQGYTLPEGLLLMPNMYHIHHNPDIWGDPEIFRPQRFLSENNGDSLKEHLVPFQAGKRQCMGEPVAKNLLFLFISKIFQQFHVTLDPNIPVENYLEADVALIRLPKRLGLMLTAR